MSTVYEIRVHGALPPRLLEALCVDVAMTTDTVLRGVIEDQAALHGLLAQIRDIGLELVDVRQVPVHETGPTE